MPSLSCHYRRKLPPPTPGAELDNSIQRHQLAAIADPHTSLAQLCRSSAVPDHGERPLGIWAKDPSIASRLNDSLAPASEQNG